MSSKHELQKHNERWKGSADKEGNLDVQIQEGIIGYEVLNNVLRSFIGKAIKTRRQIKVTTALR